VHEDWSWCSVSRLTVHRTVGTDGEGFVMIPNRIARPGGGLSGLAVAVLVHLLSHDDGFDVTAETIARQFKNGRDAVRKALNELQAAGYLEHSKCRDHEGRWQHYMAVYDEPRRPREPRTDSQALESSAWIPGDWISGPIKKTTEKTKKNLWVNDVTCDASSPNAAPPPQAALADLEELLDGAGGSHLEAEATWRVLQTVHGAIHPVSWLRAIADRGELDGFIGGGQLEPELLEEPPLTVRVTLASENARKDAS
jgi:hypothetical protein